MGQFRRALAVVACAVAFGCGSHGPRHVSDEDPGDKIPAIKSAVQKHDSSAIPQLVKDLESDDPAVRFYAIDALKSFTGQTFGYRYYEDDEQRKPSVLQWKEWLKKSGFKVKDE